MENRTSLWNVVMTGNQRTVIPGFQNTMIIGVKQKYTIGIQLLCYILWRLPRVFAKSTIVSIFWNSEFQLVFEFDGLFTYFRKKVYISVKNTQYFSILYKCCTNLLFFQTLINNWYSNISYKNQDIQNLNFDSNLFSGYSIGSEVNTCTM